MKKELDLLLSAMRGSTPPSSLSFLERVSLFDWNDTDDDDIQACSEIVLRLTADAIICSTDYDNILKLEYKKLLLRIAANIDQSSLYSKSEDIENFMRKFFARIAEFG